jgi:hypothetical protein
MTRKKPVRKPSRRGNGRRWSAQVTRRSDALDLEPGVFRKSPRAIAASLSRSAARSRRRKAGPYQSAMSMLTFYANRGGRGLSAAQKAKLERAKEELRRLHGRPPRTSSRSSRRPGKKRER